VSRAERRGPRPAGSLGSLVRLPEPGEEDDGLVRLNRNERLEPLPDWFVERLRSLVQSNLLTSYPVTDRLYAALAESLSLDRSQLLLSPGSDAAVKALYHAYVDTGDRVVMLDPSYAMYRVYADMFDAEATRVRFESLDGVGVERLLAAIVPGVKLVLIANPNQPTGTLMPEEALLDVVRRALEVDALVAVDEAYYPFSGATILPHVADLPNLAVLRSFSKAAGLAGLRLGFVAADAHVVDDLFKVRSVHDVNAFAMACALELLAQPKVIDDYVDHVRQGERVLRERAEALGLSVAQSYANFSLIDVASRCPPAELVKRLHDRGYLVRGPFSAPPLARHIRVTLGPPHVMTAFCDALADSLSREQADGDS
jgi:histidinol-phosphate aminotransferase